MIQSLLFQHVKLFFILLWVLMFLLWFFGHFVWKRNPFIICSLPCSCCFPISCMAWNSLSRCAAWDHYLQPHDLLCFLEMQRSFLCLCRNRYLLSSGRKKKKRTTLIWNDSLNMTRADWSNTNRPVRNNKDIAYFRRHKNQDISKLCCTDHVSKIT